jgi:hypothetical protein
MTFSDDSINNLIVIWEREFGIRMSPAEARAEAARLMELCWLLAQPLPGERGTGSNTTA